MAIEVRPYTPYNFIENYTEIETSFIIELIKQSHHGIELLESQVAEKISKLENEEPDGNPLYDEHFNLRKTIPIYINRAYFILSFALFEKIFNELIAKAQSEEKHQIKVDDLKGNSDIEKNYKYAKLVLEIDLERVNEEWKLIKSCQKLRNNIVHNYSQHDRFDDPKKLNVEIKSFKGKVILDGNEIKIQDIQFNLDFCNCYLRFFNYIKTELELRYLKEKSI